jgi:hypothetical protein
MTVSDAELAEWLTRVTRWWVGDARAKADAVIERLRTLAEAQHPRA